MHTEKKQKEEEMNLRHMSGPGRVPRQPWELAADADSDSRDPMHLQVTRPTAHHTWLLLICHYTLPPHGRSFQAQHLQVVAILCLSTLLVGDIAETAACNHLISCLSP
jgi:hypothetical protein